MQAGSATTARATAAISRCGCWPATSIPAAAAALAQVDARGADRQGHGVADAQGPGRDWNSFLETAEGSFSASFGPGSINGFDLAAFLDRFKQGGFFPLREVSSGSVSIDRAEVRATLAEGAARIEKAEAKIGERVLALSGVIPYVGGGLALSGAVARPDAGSADATTAEASFFVGGSWSAPFVSPIFSGTLVRPAAAGRERLTEANQRAATSTAHSVARQAAHRASSSFFVLFATAATPLRQPRSAACSSTMRCASRRLLAIDAMMMPTATTAISSVQTALISGVTPSRTWL